MRSSVTEAKDQLTDLVRRAEAGEEVILTRGGRAAVRLLAVDTLLNRKPRNELIRTVRASAAAKLGRGSSAARS